MVSSDGCGSILTGASTLDVNSPSEVAVKSITGSDGLVDVGNDDVGVYTLELVESVDSGREGCVRAASRSLLAATSSGDNQSSVSPIGISSSRGVWYLCSTTSSLQQSGGLLSGANTVSNSES